MKTCNAKKFVIVVLLSDANYEDKWMAGLLVINRVFKKIKHMKARLPPWRFYCVKSTADVCANTIKHRLLAKVVMMFFATFQQLCSHSSLLEYIYTTNIRVLYQFTYHGVAQVSLGIVVW